MIHKMIKLIKDLKLPFSECRLCKHKEHCNYKVWLNPYDDCKYWELHYKNRY